MGLIRYEKYEPIRLTEEGTKKANEVLQIHKLLKNFLTQVLKVSEAAAEKDACRIEHVISRETISSIMAFMDHTVED